MIVDDKKRVIGKITSINSDRFIVELLSGMKNFNINGFDDIHYFAQINSYIIIPYQEYYIVSEVVNVREKDNILTSNNQKEQELNKVYSTKTLEVLPIGTIKKENIDGKKKNKFCFGVSVYPTLYSDALYIKDDELDCIFEVNNSLIPKCYVCDSDDNCEKHLNNRYKGQTRLTALEIGKSAIFEDYDIKIKIDDFFGGHSAILGNTGSGKSCTISSMIQTLYSKIDDNQLSAIGSTFIIFDVNGEYKKAFSELNNIDNNINVEYKNIDDNFILPHYFLNVEEWELLLNASEKAQLPILRNALQIAGLIKKSTSNTTSKTVLNHIKAICIDLIIKGEGNDTYKSSKIATILRAFDTNDFELNTNITFKDKNQTQHSLTFAQCINLSYGKMYNVDAVLYGLTSLGFIKSNIKLFESTDIEPFDFDVLGDALELAILYEEAHGNAQIRNHTASLVTRFKSLQNRDDFNFLKDAGDEKLENYLKDLFGIKNSKKTNQITLIDLNSAEDEIVEIISAVITRLIFDTLRKAKNRNIFPVNLVLEEAHRYIAYESKRTFLRANQIFDRVAKEGRKYGLFFLISSQRPSELSKTVLSQCNNFIVHRIQNPDDLSHIRQITPHISEATLKKLPSIPRQHALIFGNAVNIPTLYKVKNADPLPDSDNNKINDNWFVDGMDIVNLFD